MQILKTKQFGEITFTKTWVEGSIHIGKLAGGGYLHVTGQPIGSEHEIRAVIPKGDHLDDALNWYRNRDKEPEDVKRRIMINPDGSYSFDNGEPVNTITELVQCIPPGPALDAAVTWFTERSQKEKKTLADGRETGQQQAKAKPALKPAVKKPVPVAPKKKAPVALPVAVTPNPVTPQAIVD